ncbi:cache domain-containing protein [Pontibacter anaerobius]|uniref:Cache domain-containing protein n=1 Tax=Pontibacter anaerobius TaxID=2993940 RepID=A0ABT3RGZ5_9BACT|nr:cache domain-containing protein [Pontibacter anaerobius]MCX2740899.1 cache domain-containing protein [Pontibacter anaerobius]
MKKNNHPSVGRQTAPDTAGVSAENTQPATAGHEYRETRELVQLVQEAADLLHVKGEAAFEDFGKAGSRWRKGESYVFVLDPEGNMLVHPDTSMVGKNQLELKDMNGKPIIRGLISAATATPNKPEGWYHYEWPVPGGLLPRWKSSYVQLVTSPSGKQYIVGSGMYNDRMEREYVVDMVSRAVTAVEQQGKDAFNLLRDPAGPFRVKDAYIFIIGMDGVEILNPAFPNLEGRDLLDMKDTQGKLLNQEMIRMVQAQGAGWMDYMWPKPGENVSTQKSAYVHKAKLQGKDVMVGCGVYLADAPKEKQPATSMTAQELVKLVNEAAVLLEQKGEGAFPEMRQQGSKWLHDEIYFFVWSLDGVRVFHGELPEGEGKDVRGLKDALGKPIGRMFLEIASAPEGQGWLHAMWPKPFEIFPTWKSCYVKRVTFPSGKQYLVGSGLYNMQLDEHLLEDVVNQAAILIKETGKDAFNLLRDKKGPFYFMDTYVFVQTPDGTELVNPAQPSLEGKNLIDLKDLQGKEVVKEEIAAAMEQGSAWLEHYWYKPGDNTPALKKTFVRKVQHNGEAYVVGSGIYIENKQGTDMNKDISKFSWDTVEKEEMSDSVSRQVINGEKATLAHFTAKKGYEIHRHSHPNEEYMLVTRGAMQYQVDDHDVEVRANEVLVLPPDKPHSIVVLEDTEFLVFFAPARQDWLKGEDQYLRK